MTKINRRYIDKHWLVFIMRGTLAGLFGLMMLFNGLLDMSSILLPVCVYLLAMGAIDAVSAIYNSPKRHGWITCLADAVVDVLAALVLLFAGRDSLINSVVILSIYTIISGIIDLFHGFLSTVDPTDKFIRILVGAFGCIVGLVILNAGNFEMMAFSRFFGAYVLMVGVTSLIYGVHNRSQCVEDSVARQETSRKSSKSTKK